MLEQTSSSVSSLYISSQARVPDRSTWFWIPDKSLKRYETDFDGNIKEYYRYQNRTYDVKIRYVELQQKSDNIIQQGTLVRLSLARWYRFNSNTTPDGFYLQLSGWY